MCGPTSFKKSSSEATVAKGDRLIQFAILAPVLTGLLINTFPDVIESSLALDLYKFSHNINVGACVLTFLAVVFDPPSFLKGSQAVRYGQLSGFGFLPVAVQSYLCAKGAAHSILSESDVITTATVILFNAAFVTLTWPMRIHEKSPPINEAEKFFCSLAIVVSVGMVPALCLK